MKEMADGQKWKEGKHFTNIQTTDKLQTSSLLANVQTTEQFLTNSRVTEAAEAHNECVGFSTDTICCAWKV